jgi:hypothetical protein
MPRTRSGRRWRSPRRPPRRGTGWPGQPPRLGQPLAESQLDGGAGVPTARSGGLEVGVLVVAAGHVVIEDAADAAGGVEAGEERDHGKALHGHRQVLAHHLGQLVGLALQRECGALDLLVVLELHLEEADHLDGHTGRAGDGHGGIAVGREDLLHGVVGDDIAGSGPTVARHDHAVGIAQGHHGGGVGHRERRRPSLRHRWSVAERRCPLSFAGGRRSPGPDRSPGETEGAPLVTTARPFARSCARTPRRCPRAPRRSRRAGRPVRP